MSDKNTPELTADESALISAFRSGNRADIVALTGKLLLKHEAPEPLAAEPITPPTPELAAWEKDDALYTAVIRAQFAYAIPLSERLAMFVLSRLVLRGYFSQAIYFDGLQNTVKDIAEALREAILDSQETTHFVRAIQQEKAGQ